MKLHLLVVAISNVLVVSTTAVQPYLHVNRLDDDESVTANQHKYAEGDNGNNRYVKAEIRERDRASGHYNVLTQQSAVDVKYVADESGYHPSVKYNHSDDHSRASTTLTFGKGVVNILETGKSDTSSATIERRLIQALEPNQKKEQNVAKDYVSTFGLNKLSNIAESHSTPGDIGLQHGLRVNPSVSDQSYSHTTIVNQKQDDAASIDFEGDSPMVENDGSFGQRLQAHNNQFIQSSTTSNPVTAHSELSTSSTRSGRYLRIKPQHKISKPYLPDIIPGLGAYSSTPSTSLDSSFTANSIEFKGDRVQKHENNRIPDSLGLQSYIPSGSPLLATNNPLLVNYASHGVSLNISGKSSTTAVDAARKEYGFLKPIVVADTTEDRPFQYSTTFECEDDVTTSAPDLLGLGEKALDKTSSHVLNSIQAGVSLVNAGETHLIASTNEIHPAPVKEEVQETDPFDNPLVELSNMLGIQRNKYIPARPPFNGKKDLLKEQAQRDESVEIQKSVEIFPSLPAHEIHYPEEGIPAHGGNLQIPFNNGVNSLQLNDNNDPLLHEVSDSQPKDSVTIQPVYVVPPATYTLDGSSPFKNDGQLDQASQSTQDNDQNSPLIKSQELESSLYHQAYQSTPDVNHKSGAAQNGGQNYNLHPESSAGIVYAEDSDESSNHPAQRATEKQVPLSIEHIIESRLPIPPPYPHSSGVPESYSIPTHIQKAHEKRGPLSVPIPSPFFNRKQNHNLHPPNGILDKHLYIPIGAGIVPPIPQPYPLESKRVAERKVPQLNEPLKFVEKPMTIHAPYGVQYGVSYQKIMKPQNPGLYSHWPKRPTHSYALPAPPIYVSKDSNNIFGPKQNELSHNKLNHSQFFRGQVPTLGLSQGKGSVTKLIRDNNLPHIHNPPNAYLDRRHSPIFRTNEPERIGYLGPVPALQHVQRHNGFPSKGLSSIPHHVVERRHNFRRGRSHEPAKYPQKGNFRQSKVEYGFKPPLVPSVQYDEDTASKVES